MADTWASFAPQDFQVAFYPTEIHSPGGHPWRYPNAKEAAPAGWVPLERCMNINPLRKNRPDGSFAYYNLFFKTSGQYGGTRNKRNKKCSTRKNNRK